jgi:hypothetical protein
MCPERDGRRFSWREIRDPSAGSRIFDGKLPRNLKSLLRRVGSEFPHSPLQVAAEVNVVSLHR